jgi:hypothetical protein
MLRQSGKKFVMGAAALLILSATWLASASQAATIIGTPVQLSTLVGNPTGTVLVGDKLFENFGYTFTGDMPSAAGVNVIPILDDLGNYGIRFQGAFVDLLSSVGGSDALITYKVTATAEGKLISDAHLAGNPNLLGTTGSVSVTETFLPLGAGGEYTMEIYDDEQNPDAPKLVDSTVFAVPVKSLNVQKDILIHAGNQSATLSFVDQSFSQIPEATTVTMALIGLVSWAGATRRKR